MFSLALVSARQDPAACASEFQDVQRTTGLRPSDIDHRIIDSTTVTLGDMRGVDGVIVGGSSLNVTDDVHSPYQQHVHRELAQLLELDVPTLFICFGNTYLADITGGTVDRCHPEPAGSTTVELTDAGRTDPLTQHLPDSFHAFTGHKEAVSAVGQGVRVLASGPTCPVQLVRANRSTWASQFHPDLDYEGMAARMSFNLTGGYFSPEDYEGIVARLAAVETAAANSIMRRFVEICRAWPLGGSELEAERHAERSRVGAH
ncbi:glutamine amidotransferase [Corynebacterium uropygiale]|uniref:Glutamine amidotransferase n=1 Tax=Corynebacterium uropygiale TaxID=1775911 RepID=A0A9X1QQL0_9CORY|nr:glutamine amidotransferase [Corynebacterium uropygiale]MCF4006617.1 glutamine amidotransferase [Corynebacterium uropygiale]